MSLSGRRITVLAVCGTRPDTVKMAPVVLELRKHPESVETILAVTGQHREMLEQALRAFNLVPDCNLDIMAHRQTLSQITVRALEGLDKVIENTSPDLVIAQGDTTTTFVAALSAFYHRVPFGHVEAGLRTDNKYDPFPEEVNRRLAGVLSDLHFAPTVRAKENLLREGVREDSIFVTGNTGIDALLTVASGDFEFADAELAGAAASGKMILVTAHRRENWGARLKSICEAIREIAAADPDVRIVFAVHRNPIVREIVFPELEAADRVLLIEPPDYVPFVHLMKAARLILTDSGGVQEEAPALGKPVLVLRETTERPEGIEAGCAKLVGTNAADIVSETLRLLHDEAAYSTMSRAVSPYGDGHAAERIWEAIKARFELG